MINELKKARVKIDSILSGISPLFHGMGEYNYLFGYGIDPEQETTRGYPVGNIISPSVGYAYKTSSSFGGNTNNPIVWITSSTESSQGLYAYSAQGTLYTWNGAFQSGEEGGIIKPTESMTMAPGMVSYMDYIYLATPTTIARFGPVSATAPTLTNDYWNDSAGLGQARLTNTDYQSTTSLTYSNHAMHLHNDGYVYVADYASGIGLIHSFYITSAGVTTAAYADLILPPGYLPYDIKSFGTDLAIACSARQYNSGSEPLVTRGAVFLWDTVSENFYRQIDVPDSIVSALAIKNGELFILSGQRNLGVNVRKYLGGNSTQLIASLGKGWSPPRASAVAVNGNRIAFGSNRVVDNAIEGAYVIMVGYTNSDLPSTALNCTQQVSAIGDDYPEITNVNYFLSSLTAAGHPVVSWRSDGNGSGNKNGIDFWNSGSGLGNVNSIFKSKVFDVGSKFYIRRIRLPFPNGVPTDVEPTMGIQPYVYMDNASVVHSSASMPMINAFNYPATSMTPNGEKVVEFNDVNFLGYNNFYLEFRWANGSSVASMGLPITIDLDIYD
jgi:hypothetical protein